MIDLLYQGQWPLFLLILFALVISLTFHEYGHAATAKLYGDTTAERMGRLTLNPLAHIDPLGLMMVVLVGFGFAKPVPTDPRNYTSRYADLFVAAAGPGMNLVLAFFSINLLALAQIQGWAYFSQPGPELFFSYMAQFNLILMLFNLIPLGALDGHYILPYFLPRKTALYYTHYNERYGNMALFGLVILSMVGVPVFQMVWALGGAMRGWILVV